MTNPIYIGNPFGGLVTRVKPFNLQDNQFAQLFNAYSWRGEVKRKRGTSTLDRLNRQILMVASPTDPWDRPAITLVADAGNLITGNSLQSNSSIEPGSITLVEGANTYTEPATPDGTLVGAPAGSGTIDYSTGDFTITGAGAGTVTGTFDYYPNLPVLGLRSYAPNNRTNQFPLTIAFDTTYAYQINQASNQKNFFNVSYYKSSGVPFTWTNSDADQFWSENFQSAFWVTNNKSGLHYVDATYTSGSGTTDITMNLKSLGIDVNYLVIGDVIFFNQWSGSTINGLNGTVSNIADAVNGNYIITFDVSVTVAGTGYGFLLTNTIAGQDGIRFYDGDMTSGTGIPQNTNTGWVNFSPPLTATTTTINDLDPALYYLVGALIIVAFKDRLVFFGPYIQTPGGLVYQRPIQDTAIFSWNGTPYYNALVPTSTTTNESFNAEAYYVDEPGKGGFQSAGLSLPVKTVINNTDVLLVGFGGSGTKTRFIYTNNDLQPFLFYLINSEFPSTSTFSSIEMDKGGIEVGQYGITFTSQTACVRVDNDIPNQIFEIQAVNDGYRRVNGIRDFYNEWIYFSYPTGNGSASQGSWIYPNTTLFYNYKDQTWALFRENFTSHGTFRSTSNYTWLTLPFITWNDWKEPWTAGQELAQFPSIIAGNPQGYVLIKDEGTGEAPSGDIKVIVDNGDGLTRITAINHCVNVGEYLYFQSCIGSTYLNGQIARVEATPTANTFDIDINYTSGTYLGLGTYTRLIQPLIQTKQFNFFWNKGKKVLIEGQKYLLDSTQDSQITVNLYLNQNTQIKYNAGPIVPDTESVNNSLVATDILYTCPELENIGLTPSNVNLLMPTAASQTQIWHRMNTALEGDSFQIGLTLSDEQMRNLTYATSEIVLHAMQFTVTDASDLA